MLTDCTVSAMAAARNCLERVLGTELLGDCAASELKGDWAAWWKSVTVLMGVPVEAPESRSETKTSNSAGGTKGPRARASLLGEMLSSTFTDSSATCFTLIAQLCVNFEACLEKTCFPDGFRGSASMGIGAILPFCWDLRTMAQ